MRRATMKPGDKAESKFEPESIDASEVGSIDELAGEPLAPKPLPVPSAEAAQEATASKLVTPVEAPHVKKQFVVANHSGRNVMLHGGMILLRQGKVVDDVNYDIAYLQSQGVQLTPYNELK